MSTVVIRPDDGQADSLKALLAEIRKHSGDEPVRTGEGGVVVSRETARKFLTAKHTTDAATSGHTVDNTREPLTTIHTDSSTGQEQHPDDSHNHPDDTVIGGRTPDGELPGGYEGVRADQRDNPTPEPEPKKSTPAKKAAPAKKTAAAAQRASRSTTTRSDR